MRMIAGRGLAIASWKALARAEGLGKMIRENRAGSLSQVPRKKMKMKRKTRMMVSRLDLNSNLTLPMTLHFAYDLTLIDLPLINLY